MSDKEKQTLKDAVEKLSKAIQKEKSKDDKPKTPKPGDKGNGK